MHIDPVTFAGDGRADDVDDGDDPSTLSLDLRHGGERVGGLSGLTDGDVQHVGLDDRVAVAELARRLGIGGNASQVLDQLGAGNTGVER